MRADRKCIHSSFIARLLGAAALGGAMLIVTDAVGVHAAWAGTVNPGAMNPPPAPPAQSDSSDKSSTPSEADEDKNRRPNPELDDLDDFGTFGRGRKPRPNLPAPATGAGTADDEAAANDAVAAAAKARASKPKSNIDMPDAMRAERCANNRARIAELEGLLASLGHYAGSLGEAESRSAELFDDLPASSAEYALARADVKQLKAAMAQLGNQADLQSQLAWHKNNLIALGCD